MISWFTIYNLIPILKRFSPDLPNSRSIHTQPIPRGGGIVIALVSSFSIANSGNIFPLLCLPLAFIGIIDDKYKVSNDPSVKPSPINMSAFVVINRETIIIFIMVREKIFFIIHL